MSLTDTEIANKLNLKCGDIVKFERIDSQLTQYYRAGLYVGDGNVIHIASREDAKVKTGEFVIVRKDPLKNVAGDDKCEVQHFDQYKYSLGLSGQSTDKAVRMAHEMIDYESTYSIQSSTCQHFLILLKHYIELVDQAETASTEALCKGVFGGLYTGVIGGPIIGAVVGFSIAGPAGILPGICLGLGPGTAATSTIGLTAGHLMQDKARVARQRSLQDAWGKVLQSDKS